MNAQSRVHNGPDLDSVTQETVEFLSISGDSRVQLLPDRWPAGGLPSPTSSLFSVANKNGLVAAASPNALVIASTDTIRKTFESRDIQPDSNNVKHFNPELTVPVPRLSQIAFSSDESTLTICAEQGGGLQIYDVTKLKQGNTQSEFAINTQGTSVRALIPNPATETAHLMGVILADGKFMIADLKARTFVNGRNGPVLTDNVTCASWSARGKQVLAGRGDGTAAQLKPDGSVQAEIPKAPQLTADEHISSLLWLTNDLIFAVYTPTTFSADVNPDSTMVLVTREPRTSNFNFQKIPDAPGNFGLPRNPPHYFFSRLREWGPNLSDLLVYVATNSTEIGMVANSKTPLTKDPSAAASAGNYVSVEQASDSRRAVFPMSPEGEDLTSIGTIIDLSSREKVKGAVPPEEMDETATPLPLLLVLDDRGSLIGWWIVYKDSIRARQGFSGLVAVDGQSAFSASQSSTLGMQTSNITSQSTTQSTFGTTTSTSAFGGGGFGKPAAFGSTSTPGFGTSAALGTGSSPWSSGGPTAGIQSAFGKPSTFGQTSQLAFGKPSAPGAPAATSGFGQLGGLGSKTSPWASAPGSGPGNTAAGVGSPFAAMAGSSNTSASPFTNTSSSSPFGGLGSGQQSLFGGSNAKPAALTSQTSTGSFVTLPSGTANSFEAPSNFSVSAFGTPSLSNNASGKQDADDDMMDDSTEDKTSAAKSNETKSEETKAVSGLFGLPAGGFKLHTDAPKPSEPKEISAPSTSVGDSLFGSGFASALDLGAKKDVPVKEEPKSPTTGGLFGNLSSTVTNKSDIATTATSENVSDVAAKLLSDKNQPSTLKLNATPSTEPRSAAPQKAAPEDAPLPPDPTPSGAADEEESSAVEDDIPLPPDPTPAQRKAAAGPIPGLPQVKSAETSKPPSLKWEDVTGPSDDIPLPPDPTPAQRKAAAQPIPGIPESPKTASDDKTETSLSPVGSEPVDLGASGTSLPPDDPEDDEAAATTGTVRINKSAVKVQGAARKQPLFGELPKTASTDGPKFSFADQAKPSTTSSLFGKAERNFTAPASFKPANATNPPFMFAPSDQTSPDKLPRSPSPVRPPQPGTILRGQSPTRTPSISPNRNRNRSSQRTPSPSRQVSFAASTTPLAPPPLAQPPLTQSAQTLQPPTQILLQPVPRTVSKNFGLQPGTRLPTVTERNDSKEEPLVDLYLNDELLRNQRELEAPIDPTRELGPFLASTNYIEGIKPGHDVVNSVERLYCDITSMVDTLGLNARALASFVSWHSSPADSSRSPDVDLEPSRELTWHLAEIEDLAILEKDLADDLDGTMVQDIPSKLSECTELLRETLRLRKAASGLVKSVAARTARAESRGAPLSVEQAGLLKDIRGLFGKTQSLLSKAEDELSLLRARLAAAETASASSRSRVPTVEATVTTIAKMTRMAEGKSTDIDVLEAQMRKLGFRVKAGEDLGMSRLSLRGSASPRSAAFRTPTRRSVVRGTFSADFDEEGEDEIERVTPRSATRVRVSEEDLKVRIARKQLGEILRRKVGVRGTVRTEGRVRGGN